MFKKFETFPTIKIIFTFLNICFFICLGVFILAIILLLVYEAIGDCPTCIGLIGGPILILLAGALILFGGISILTWFIYFFYVWGSKPDITKEK